MIGDTEFKVPTIPTTNDNHTPDDKPPPSFSDFNQQICNEKGVESLKGISAEILRRLLYYSRACSGMPPSAPLQILIVKSRGITCIPYYISAENSLVA